MNQVLNEILSEIERAPSQVAQQQWMKMVQLLRDEPDQKDSVYSRLYQVLDTNALAAPAYAKWIYALYHEADLKEALEIAEHADKRYPNSRDVLVLFGMSLRKAGQTEKAITKYEQVIALHPGKDFDAHYNLGNALLEKDAAKAEENYRAAVSIKPGSAVAHYGLGLALQKQGRTGEALTELETARTLNPRDSDICIALGNARLDSDPVAAERDYAEAANISGSARAYYNWGIALARNNKPANAEEKYIRATEIEGDYANAYYNLGVLLQSDPKRLEDAKLRYRQAIAVDPNHADAHLNLGLLLSDGGEFDEAVAEYDAAAQANPGYADAYYNCAGVLVRLQRFHDAAERCAKAISVGPPAGSDRKAKIHYIWGLALENDEEIPERDRLVRAAEKYENAIDSDPAFADAFFALGNVRYGQEKEKAALADWEVTVKLQPDFAYAWHNIADLYHREGQYKLGWDTWQKAKAAYQRTASQNAATTEAEKPPRAYFFYVLGTMQQDVFRELERAEESYRKACELSPQFTGPRCSLVRLYLERAEQSVHRSELSENTGDPFDQRARFSTEAWRAYLDADALLEAEIDKATLKERKFNALLQRGELHLMMKDFDGAEKFLLQARDLNDSGPRVWTGLGVLYGRKEDAAKAVENFEEALRRKPKDLGTRSNLANAYQSRGWFDLAETEYKRVLHVADGHIEAHLGLGETYMSLAEAGDSDFYLKAIECFETALGLGSKRRGSKLLGDREIAAIHFYLGVAKSKLLEKGAAEKGDTLLKSAFQSFEACHQKDPENYQAARAKDKIKSELCDPAPRLRRLAESYGAVLILLPCLTALLLVQTSFFFKWPVRHLDPGYYATLSFGLLVFVVAALYLPQILKLEVGAVKLEKSLTEAVPKAPVVLGLKWKAQRLPVLDPQLSSQLPAPGEGKKAAGEKSTVKDLKT